MLLSSITTATLGWIHQQRVRAQFKSCLYHLQLLGLHRVLEPGLIMREHSDLNPPSGSRKKISLLSRECFLPSFFPSFYLLFLPYLFCTSKRVGVCCSHHRKPNCFFCLPSGCLISPDFTLQFFRWGPVVEWSWTSWHSGLSPVPPTAQMRWNLQTDEKQTTGPKRSEEVDLVTLWNTEAIANENWWGLMPGAGAGSGTQTLIAPSHGSAWLSSPRVWNSSVLQKKSLWEIFLLKREGNWERQSHQQAQQCSACGTDATQNIPCSLRKSVY